MTVDRQSVRPIVHSTRAIALLILVAALVGLGLRLPAIERRPLHQDESVQAVKTGELIDTGRYQYDPYEFHGPTLYFLTLPVAWMSGVESFAQSRPLTFRLVPLIFGLGVILLFAMIVDGLGWAAAGAAGLTAISPAMAFYSLYYVQEMLLVFFGFVVIATGWRYVRSPRLGWALLCGAGLGLMHATKETCVLAYVAMAVALILGRIWTRREGERSEPVSATGRLRIHVVLGLVVATATSIIFFSSFFTHARGPLDSILTYGHYLSRAGGQGTQSLHEHPWYYYLRMLAFAKYGPGPWWSEGLILALALIGVIGIVRKSGTDGMDLPLSRFMVIYTILITAMYSLIPYKTPWLMLSFLHGMILLAGIGLVVVARWIPAGVPRWVMALVLLGLGAQLAAQAWRSNMHKVFNVDTRNPYVYAHSTHGPARLADRIEALAQLHPDGRGMLVRIVSDDYWPLPFYLRRMERVGYWHSPQDLPPGPADAPVIITMPPHEEALASRLEGRYQVEFRGLRPEVLLVVYIDEELWKAYLKTVETVGGR